MDALAREVISDELELLRRVVPLVRARVIELGCGKAEMARRLMEMSVVESVTALEVDRTQFFKNVADPHLSDIDFVMAGAESIPFDAERFDVAIMLKSLHHVPLVSMGAALGEIRRVLRPDGYLYVSEPVFAGDFNEIMRLFHDEKVQRAAAHDAIRRAVAEGAFLSVGEIAFDAPIAFRDFDDFVERMARVTHSDLSLEGAVLAEVRRRFETHMSGGAARFARPMRVNLLKRGYAIAPTLRRVP